MSNITREEAIEMLKSKMDGSVDTSYEWAETVRMAIEALQDRPTGEWILAALQDEDEIRNGNYFYECSNCNHMDLHAKGQEVPYCWYCGADMRGKEDG